MIRRPPRPTLFPYTPPSRSIAASIPAATPGAMPELGAADAQAGTAGIGNTAPTPATEQVGVRRFGIWDLAANVLRLQRDRKSTRLNSSHLVSSYAVFCLKKQ